MPLILALLIFGAGWFYFGGYHIVHKPTPEQLFGCKDTYVNAKGEDTGECG